MMKSSVLQGGMKPTLARCFDQRDGMRYAGVSGQCRAFDCGNGVVSSVHQIRDVYIFSENNS